MSRLVLIQDNRSQSNLAVIFIHGLNGNMTETWSVNPNDESTYWPKWVGEESVASVWAFEYQSSISKYRGDALTMKPQADAFLETLSSESALKDSRLCLIGHSFGGVLIKNALVSAKTKGVARHEKILDQIKCAVLIATPNLGSHVANIARALSLGIRTNPQVVQLRRNDAELIELGQQFRSIALERRILVRSFYEARPTFLGKIYFGIKFGRKVIIVPRESADPSMPGDLAIAILEDHFAICKPKNRKELLHSSLINVLGELTEALATVRDPLELIAGISEHLVSVSEELKNATRTILEHNNYPKEMAIGKRIVHNPIWVAEENSSHVSYPPNEFLIGHMLIAKARASNGETGLLCYWSERWKCYLFPFVKADSFSNPIGSEVSFVEKHVASRYGGSARRTGKYFASLKLNAEYQKEVWLYMFEIHELNLPRGYKLRSTERILTLSQLSDPDGRESAQNGDAIRAIRTYFGKGLHGISESRPEL